MKKRSDLSKSVVVYLGFGTKTFSVETIEKSFRTEINYANCHNLVMN